MLHLETEKIALVSPRSPCPSSRTTNTIPHQRRLHAQHSVDETEISPSSAVQTHRNHPSIVSIIPMGRQSTRAQPANIHTVEVDHHYFSPTELTRSRTPIDFRKKAHIVYVLPVSPALSSSSSTTNPDEMIRTGSSTMPIRSRRQLSSSINTHHQSTSRGIKNQSFDQSPQPKTRTLPRSQNNTLQHTSPPSQPPPLPPALDFNNVHASKSVSERKLASMGLDPSALSLRFCNENIYGPVDDHQMKKSAPPPVPCRMQKPMVLPIGFEELITQAMVQSPCHDECSEHSWPKPPEALTASQISGPPQTLSPSIPYDRLHHEHLISDGAMRHQSTSSFFHLARHGDHSMLTESDT